MLSSLSADSVHHTQMSLDLQYDASLTASQNEFVSQDFLAPSPFSSFVTPPFSSLSFNSPCSKTQCGMLTLCQYHHTVGWPSHQNPQNATFELHLSGFASLTLRFILASSWFNHHTLLTVSDCSLGLFEFVRFILSCSLPLREWSTTVVPQFL